MCVVYYLRSVSPGNGLGYEDSCARIFKATVPCGKSMGSEGLARTDKRDREAREPFKAKSQLQPDPLASRGV